MRAEEYYLPDEPTGEEQMMPKFDDVFGSASGYLKASDIPKGKAVKVKVEGVEVREFNRDDGKKEKKAILTFEGREKSLVCNKTNGRVISDNVGSDELDDWVGAELILYVARVDFQGQTVDAIRVKAKEPEVEVVDEDVPF